MRKRKWLDGITGVAIGDALGSPVQFHKRGEVVVEEMVPCKHFGTPAGAWTDDTSLTLATLDSIRLCKEINLHDIMYRFTLWLNEGHYSSIGKAFDVGITCMRAIQNYDVKKDVNTCGLKSESSNGNGSLMRIMPACLAGSLEDTEKVSALTHAHPRSIIACGIYWFIVQELVNESGELKDLIQNGLTKAFDHYANEPEIMEFERLRDTESFAQCPVDDISSSGYCVHTLEAAIWSLLNGKDFASTLLLAVNLGDDADSVGAVCGGLAGLYYGYDNFPVKWVNKLMHYENIYRLIEEVEQ